MKKIRPFKEDTTYQRNGIPETSAFFATFGLLILLAVLIGIFQISNMKRHQHYKRLDGKTKPIEYRLTLSINPQSYVFNGTLDVKIAILRSTNIIELNGHNLDIENVKIKCTNI
ncbi:hypothetical protein GJ496_011683 [Pomphorhynchus laevis]|nr:hypothetical protein GJ496_011683 [Pomphorhynchus laevis]